MLTFGQKAEWIEPLNHMRVTQSLQGVVVPLVFGTQRVPGLLAWYSDFTVHQHAQGGSAIGAKGSAIYTYSASWISILAQGPIRGINSVWDTSGKYVPQQSTTTFAIPAGISGAQPTYQVTTLNFQTDLGVTMNGSPMQRILYDYMGGAAVPTLTTGQYAADGSGNYYFSSADVGTSVTLTNSYYYKYIITQELYLVPTTQYVNVAHGGIGGDGQPIYSGDRGVRYYPSGTALVKIPSGNPAQGQYKVTVSNGIGEYWFNSADIGSEVLITYVYDDYQDMYAPAAITATFFPGILGQAGWSYLASSHPGQYISYSQVAYAAFNHAFLGMSGVPPINSYEVIGMNVIGGGYLDANPANALNTILTDQYIGINFPSSAIDNESWFTNTNSAQAWFNALELFVSHAITNQETVAGIAGQWLQAYQVASFYSEGMFKLVPFGDQSASGTLGSYTPNTAIVASIDDDAWLSQDSTATDPVKATRSPWTDAYNRVQITYQNRLADYNADLVYEQDEASIERFGMRMAPPVSYDFITTYESAAAAASMALKRNTMIRNKYTFRLPLRYEYIEPMDLIEITDATLGLNAQVVRIISVTNDFKHGLTVECEDYPGNGYAMPWNNPKAQTPPLHPIYGTAGSGATSAVVVQALNNNSNVNTTRLYIYCTGSSQYWGGCTVWVSLDGSTYTALATVTQPARIGTLTAALPSVTLNPSGALHLTTDTTSQLEIAFGNITTNAATAGIPAWSASADYVGDEQVTFDGQLWGAVQANQNSMPTVSNPNWQIIVDTSPGEVPLASVSTVAAENLGTLSAVIALSANLTPSAVEFLSYTTVASGTSPNTYTLTDLYRGALMTTIGAFPIGSQFVRFDDASTYYDVPAGYTGNTVYLRFTAVNMTGGTQQDLSTADTYEFVLQARGSGAADFGAGTSSLLNNQGSQVSGGTPLPFTYTSTDSTITWSWSAFTLYYTDGSTAASVAAGSQAAFTGLTASTTYYFGAYYDLVSQSVVVALSDVSSGTQPSSLQQSTTVLYGDTHILLFGNSTAATAATGGSGGGSGGGTSGCFSGTSQVETAEGLVEFRNLPDRFEICNRTGRHWATLLRHAGDWAMVDLGNGTHVTTSHLVRAAGAGKMIPASEAFPDKPRFNFHGIVYNMEVESANPDDHEYRVGSGLEAHNYVPVKP